MLTLTATHKRTFAADPFHLDPAGLPVTSEVVKTREFVFEDTDLAVDFLTLHLGMPEDRARLVIYRRCEFFPQGLVADRDSDGNLIAYRFASKEA